MDRNDPAYWEDSTALRRACDLTEIQLLRLIAEDAGHLLEEEPRWPAVRQERLRNNLRLWHERTQAGVYIGAIGD